MIAKIYFTKPKVNIPVNNQKELNSYIHRSLGKDNKYHNTFSNYAISSLQGGKLGINGNLIFEENPYIIMSSNNPQFIEDFLKGVQKGNEGFFDMHFLRMEIGDYNTHDYFDKVITISPILIKNKEGRKLTFKDEGWLEAINLNCKMKLLHEGIEDNTFKIELRNPERGKVKNVHVGDIFNPCSMVGLKIYGAKKTRRTLYNLGIGNSTGSGFGTIKIYE